MKKIFASVLLICFIVCLGGCSSSNQTEDSNVVETYEDENNAIKENVQENKTDDSATTGEKNALRKAEEYLNVMAFSEKGLIKQLEFEGFTNEEATYGAQNCGADWNEQALKKAKEYLDIMAFSQSGLIKQLEFEGYTNDEAKYGVENCNADWMEQAVKKAKEYLDLMAYSKDRLIKQLEFEGFTNEEATYGVEQNGY